MFTATVLVVVNAQRGRHENVRRGYTHSDTGYTVRLVVRTHMGPGRIRTEPTCPLSTRMTFRFVRVRFGSIGLYYNNHPICVCTGAIGPGERLHCATTVGGYIVRYNGQLRLRSGIIDTRGLIRALCLFEFSARNAVPCDVTFSLIRTKVSPVSELTRRDTTVSARVFTYKIAPVRCIGVAGTIHVVLCLARRNRGRHRIVPVITRAGRVRFVVLAHNLSLHTQTPCRIAGVAITTVFERVEDQRGCGPKASGRISAVVFLSCGQARQAQLCRGGCAQRRVWNINKVVARARILAHSLVLISVCKRTGDPGHAALLPAGYVYFVAVGIQTITFITRVCGL